MNVKELKEKLANVPDSMQVFVAERKTEFTYGLVNSGYVKEIAFSESVGDEILATDEVFILDEE